MRLETTAEYRPVRSDDLYERTEDRPSLMTPARRAALDALEREFQELLRAIPD